MSKAIVLVSGGMDSAVTLAVALQVNTEISMLHINYGQRTEAKELQCFILLAEHYNIKERLVIDINHLKKIGGSCLTDHSIPVPKDGIQPGIPISYVPFRNGNTLAIAVSWADYLNYNYVYYGAVEQDSSGYPDCRESFRQAYSQAAQIGTRNNIKVVAPIIKLSKKEIVTLGKTLGVPFHLTWSCYEANDRACGECDSCLLRLKGFKEAGKVDPITYKEIKHVQ